MAEGDHDRRSGDADVMFTSSSPGTSGSATLAEGGNVNQRFINSQVNVVAGDQIHGNIIIYNIVSPEVETSPSNQDIRHRKLIQTCNDNTKEVTSIDILSDFRNEQLLQPDFEVYPQMRQVHVDDYYKGRYGIINSQANENTVGRNQLTKEFGFHRQDKIEAKIIGIGDLIASLWQKDKTCSSQVVDDRNASVGVTAIVASAGSGKSTLTRRIARQALGISMGRKKSKEPPSSSQKMVHYIELKDIEGVSKIKPSKFLFGGLYRNEEDEDEAFEWLDKHQSHAILIFDGLDQIKWDFDDKNPRQIRKYDSASSWTVLYNILSRNILRHVKVVIASGEFKISELPAMARPQTIITLNGLTLDDAHRLFAFLLRDDGEVIWQKIETMSPRLVNLVSVPVFLILTAVVMGRDPSKPPPTTVTELYNKIILALQSVENIRNREQILSIVNKLKALAFQGMSQGKIVFRETDLEMFGVSAEEVQDLMTKVPANNLLSRHLMHGDFTFFFCHQSLQEYLAAVFVAESKLDEFSLFDAEHLYVERWSVVRRFLAGVVFSKPQNRLYRVSDQTKKQQLLAQSIRSRLEKTPEQHVRMELYTAIYETDDDDLVKNLPVIRASDISLSREEAHIVGSLAAKNKSLDCLNLYNCSINDELLSIIARCFKDRINVKEVDLRYNNFSETALRLLLGHRRIESLSGNLDWKVVKIIVVGWDIELKNEEDAIKISGECDGHFNIKNSTLAFEAVYSVPDLAFCAIPFEAKFIKLNQQQQMWARQEDLLKMADCKLEKMSKLLLDCTEEENIDWSLIRSYVEKYQVELLNIAVNGYTSADDYNKILERGRTISVFGNIHDVFVILGDNDFRKTVEACHQKKIEYIRCIFKRGCRASLDGISSLVNNSNLKKVSLIYRNEDDMLKGGELKNAQKIANDLDTELEVLYLYRERDVWRRIDQRFSGGVEKRALMNQR